ncbi:MAG TPA: isocitrate lyase/phosphoenolpyruvate mutase family protein [Xanthomonadaceae bacterium]|nr:isocitrate lyase/phosphoenolpyruvate mutase family protein [Xanthomonadaceae bacterium]
MPTRLERARAFRALHVRGRPLRLYPVWDGASARVVAAAGAQAVATSGLPPDQTCGWRGDGIVSQAKVMAGLRRIVTSIDLPVSFDIEGTYGPRPEDFTDCFRRALAVGAVAVTIADSVLATGVLYPVDMQVRRIRALRALADASGIPLFLNARTDVFLFATAEAHIGVQLAEALRRAAAYADAGADGCSVPGPMRRSDIARLCERSPLPVEIWLTKHSPPVAELAASGVARVNYAALPSGASLEAQRDGVQPAEPEVRALLRTFHDRW